jgi:hypothetical protein
MDLFRWFRRTKQHPHPLGKPPKEVLRLFDRHREVLRGQQLTNEAISHNTLGNTAKALELIDEALSRHAYAPAMTVKAKMLIHAEQPYQAEQWLRGCMVALDDARFDHFPKDGLRIEIYEQLGVVQFRSYGNLPEAVRLFQMALDVEQPISTELMRSSVYFELAHLYAAEGLPEDASRFCKKRLATKPDCNECRTILQYMNGFERRPYDFQQVIDALVKSLVSLGHPVALQIPSKRATSIIYKSVVPIAFAWICMQHKVKPHNFLSRPEVILLTDRAFLAMCGTHRLAACESLDASRRPSPGSPSMSSESEYGTDVKTLQDRCGMRLKSIMDSIPIADLFDGNQHAMGCLAGWGAKSLSLTKEQAVRLVDALRSVTPASPTRLERT